MLEYSHLLGREFSTTRRSWLTRLYFEWQAVRFILSELRVKAIDILVDRSWKAVEAISQDWDKLIAESKEGAVWRPLRKLLVEAKLARDAAIAADMSAYSGVQSGEPVVNSSMTIIGNALCFPESGHWTALPLDSTSEHTDFQNIYGLDAFLKSIGWELSATGPIQQFDAWAIEDSNRTQTMIAQPFAFDAPCWTVENH